MRTGVDVNSPDPDYSGSGLSVIIPTLNEASGIRALITFLKDKAKEVIVVDAGSEDGTAEIAAEAGAFVVKVDQRRRSVQLNAGAQVAKGEILYFLHADTLPPEDFDVLIHETMELGADCGCFRLRFDDNHWFLRLLGWFTRFNINAFRFGDQSLFARRSVFEKVGGYDDKLILAEDNKIVRRLQQFGRFKIIPETVVTSARRYRKNGVVRLQLVFTLLYTLFRIGVKQETLISVYKFFIR